MENTEPPSGELDVAAAPPTTPRFAFGPSFFLDQLGSFVRDRCPDPSESLPLVEIHLLDGSRLDLCHVIAITPSWLALAVREEAPTGEPSRMRTELVPYALVGRVTVRGHPHSERRMGFDTAHEPTVDDRCLGDQDAPECALLAHERGESKPAPGEPT